MAISYLSVAFAADPILVAKPDAFRTLVNPNCSHCIDEAKSRAGDLRADDPVLAWTRGKYEGGAIPIRFFLNPYRVISDTYGVFVFDPEAGFARGFEPSLDFSFYGWRNGIVVMQHKDGTLFSTLSGRAFEGPRKGEQLKPVATLPTTWGYWNKGYPGSVAYRMFEKYQPIELGPRDNADSTKTRAASDPRMAEASEVLGVSLGAAQKAYPLNVLPKDGGVVRDVLAGQEIAILWYPATQTAVAYSMRLDEDETASLDNLEFDATVPDAPYIDRNTNSRFGIEGRAVSGPLKGKTLGWIDSVQCRWFAWAAEYPETEIHGTAPPRLSKAGADARSKLPAQKTLEMVLSTPAGVTSAVIDGWRREGFTGVVLLLDEGHAAATYEAAAAIAAAKLDLYYWIEIARNERMAEVHPRWMASLGMHDDWLARFPTVEKPKKGEVAKAYPWVPIGYAEAFGAHLRRVAQLLRTVPDSYQGLLLNDLQGGPASCGCGNLQCRWALDYGVPATATPEDADDAAARFVSEVRKLAPAKEIVPVWMTECEDHDLPADKTPTGKTTGLCGSVACATGTCPRAFARQLDALLSSHTGPLGLFTAEHACGRDAQFYGGPGGWVASAVGYLDNTPLASPTPSLPHDRMWLVVQGTPEKTEAEAAARSAARHLHPGAVIVSRVSIEQSYQPRVIAVEHSAD
ncbi:MAG: DUF3179 domain-containing (seleno)protein [Pirellulales bacterium]